MFKPRPREHDATDLLTDPALICHLLYCAYHLISFLPFEISVPFLFFFVGRIGLDWMGWDGMARQDLGAGSCGIYDLSGEVGGAVGATGDEVRGFDGGVRIVRND
jgi:hypothetical protein